MRSLREGIEPGRNARDTHRRGKGSGPGKEVKDAMGCSLPFGRGYAFLPRDFALHASDHLFEVPFGAAGAVLGHVHGEALAPLAEYGSHPLTPADDDGDTDKHPVNASVLTLLVLAGACSGVSILWLATTGARWRGAIRPSWGAEGDCRWSAGAYDGLSFLGVFRL